MKLRKLNTTNAFENNASKLAKCTCVCVCFTSVAVAKASTGYGTGAVVMAGLNLLEYIVKAIVS